MVGCLWLDVYFVRLFCGLAFGWVGLGLYGFVCFVCWFGVLCLYGFFGYYTLLFVGGVLWFGFLVCGLAVF